MVVVSIALEQISIRDPKSANFAVFRSWYSWRHLATILDGTFVSYFFETYPTVPTACKCDAGKGKTGQKSSFALHNVNLVGVYVAYGHVSVCWSLSLLKNWSFFFARRVEQTRAKISIISLFFLFQTDQ